MMRYAWQDYFRRFLSQVRKWLIIERIIEEQIAVKGRAKGFHKRKFCPVCYPCVTCTGHMIPSADSACHTGSATITKPAFPSASKLAATVCCTCPLASTLRKCYPVCVTSGMCTCIPGIEYMPP